MSGAVRTRTLAPLLATSLSLAAISLAAISLAAVSPAGVAAAPPPEPPTAEASLRTGNRLFRQGDLVGAVEAYRRADPEVLASDPVLEYNLATALHRLGRLPEALLWYRRAARGLGDDPWLAENLERARAALAAPRLGPPPLLSPVLLHPWLLPVAAATAAWAALLFQAGALRASRSSRRRTRGVRGATVALLALGALLWAAHVALPRFGPRPAVLLMPCDDALPAGSEVWAWPRGRDGTGGGAGTPSAWNVRGADGVLRCGDGAVAPL